MNDIKKTSGDLLLDQGALFGRMLGQAEYLAVRPTKEGCATLAKLVLELARAIGIGHLLDSGEVRVKIYTASGKLTVKKLRGDRVRFKDFDRAQAYTEAYPDVDSSRVFTVLGREEWEGSPLRLRVDAPPFYVWPRDVNLAWNTVAERREALLAAGHTL